MSGGSGTVTGGGKYDINTQVTLTAAPASGYTFDCWLDQYGNQIAVSNTYTFVVKESTTFTAVFKSVPNNTTPPPEITLPTDEPTEPTGPTQTNPEPSDEEQPGGVPNITLPH